MRAFDSLFVTWLLLAMQYRDYWDAYIREHIAAQLIDIYCKHVCKQAVEMTMAKHKFSFIKTCAATFFFRPINSIAYCCAMRIIGLIDLYCSAARLWNIGHINGLMLIAAIYTYILFEFSRCFILIMDSF